MKQIVKVRLNDNLELTYLEVEQIETSRFLADNKVPKYVRSLETGELMMSSYGTGFWVVKYDSLSDDPNWKILFRATEDAGNEYVYVGIIMTETMTYRIKPRFIHTLHATKSIQSIVGNVTKWFAKRLLKTPMKTLLISFKL